MSPVKKSKTRFFLVIYRPYTLRIFYVYFTYTLRILYVLLYVYFTYTLRTSIGYGSLSKIIKRNGQAKNYGHSTVPSH